MPPRGRSGPPVALIVILTLVVLVGGGGGVYLATISGGAFPKPVYACSLVPATDLMALVPHGLPKGSQTSSESSCTWDNIVAENAGLEKEDADLEIRVTHYGRGLTSSAEDNAHKWLHRPGSAVRGEGQPISGYGDEALRIPKAFGGQFDAIDFRESNLVIEVGAEVDDHPGYQTALAWSRTQRAATLVHQRLASLR